MGAADKLYNGNIAETFWSTATDGGFVRNYGYKYDSLNRLKDATYQKSNSVTHNYDENLTYDKNGNIVTLLRYTHNSDGQIGAMKMDELAYDYKSPTSNQLMKVTESLSGNVSQGFIDGNTTGDDYVYDANGNMTVDNNKHITSITYNHLNLPTKIIFPTGNIVYIYNASGQKVQKVVTENTTVTTTDYLGGYQYKNTVLQFFPTAEGYVKNTPVSGTNSYSYVFNYTDHLGNVRLSYTKNPSTNALTILEESNYYPFGLKHSPYNAITPVQEYKYKYNGKELQDELGLNWDSFKYRNYDYAIGRFMCIDPLTEKYAYNSTYAFQENKMGLGRELEGLELVLTHGTFANREDRKVYSMAKADYRGGSTWQKGFSENVAKATGWEAKSTFEFTWTGNNNTADRKTAGKMLATDLMSESNPFRDSKHATLVGHSHGGNVDKEAKNILEKNGWNVDIINIATPQRTDHQTKNGKGEYLNFYSDNDAVQYVGAKPETASKGARVDANADINQEVAPSNSWLNNTAGHSFHQDPNTQNQMLETIQKSFKKK
jgi:RHS repeat-associated protein